MGTLLASSTAFLMGTVVVITLPTIQLYFHARITGIQWVVNAHLLFLAGLLLIGGALGDRFGADDIPPLEYGQAFPEESHQWTHGWVVGLWKTYPGDHYHILFSP